MATRAQRTGTKKLSEVARHVVKPAGITATGWGPVRDTCREKLGVSFDRWQDGAGRLILAERSDGLLAATIGGVGMSLPRQVGKTYLLLGMLFALCINRPGLLVIWSAHHGKTHAETFLAMQAFARRQKVAPWIDVVYTGSGDEEVRFHNRSRILFGARERGFGRGIPGVDVLVMDEAQILSDRAMDNMLATLNTSQFGLHLYIGTPPRPGDNSEAFERMRTEALSGESDDLVWIECGADPGYIPTPPPKPLTTADWAQVEKANPSYPHRTPRQSILRLRKKLKPEGFLHEGLGIWDDLNANKVTTLPGWPDRYVDAEPPPVAAIGLAVSVDGGWGSIGSADVWDDGRINLSAVERRPGSTWLVTEAKRIQDEHGCVVALDEKCPDATLAGALTDAGVSFALMKLADYVEACSDLVNRVKDHSITHQRTSDLDAAVAASAWRSVGDGRRVFGRKASSGDIDMLEAATAALWATTQTIDPWEAWT